MVSRREFLATTGSALAAAGVSAGLSSVAGAASVLQPGTQPRKRLALITTLWIYQ